MSRRGDRGEPQERRSQQDEREERTEAGRQPERLGLVVDRRLNLRGVVRLPHHVRSRDRLEGGDVGSAVAKPDGDPVFGVAAVDPVGAMESGRERDRPDGVRIRGRLDADHLEPDQRPSRHELRQWLDDVPAEPGLERPRQLMHAETERDAVERLDSVATAARHRGRARHDPQLSAGRLRVGQVGIPSGQPGEARAASQTDVEVFGESLRAAAAIWPRARHPDLPHLAPLVDPRLRMRVQRITLEDA